MGQTGPRRLWRVLIAAILSLISLLFVTILSLLWPLLSRCYGRCFPAVIPLFREPPATEENEPGQRLALILTARTTSLEKRCRAGAAGSAQCDPKRLDSINGDRRK
jgi:hypothetical protein